MLPSLRLQNRSDIRHICNSIFLYHYVWQRVCDWYVWLKLIQLKLKFAEKSRCSFLGTLAMCILRGKVTLNNGGLLHNLPHILQIALVGVELA